MDQVPKESSPFPGDRLTRRELEILALLAKHLTDREIADALFIELTTVKWYNRQIYSKLGTKKRREAITKAEALGLLVPTHLSPPAVARNLPVHLTPFIGRERELAELIELMVQPALRLVTLVGPGGMGKTRLALKIAEEQSARFSDGVFFIPFTSPGSGDYVFATLAEHIGLHPAWGSTPEEQVLDYLRDREMLLVLDNFDTVINHAESLSVLLQNAPCVKILATSRERLNLNGETIYIISGMEFPDTDRFTTSHRYSSIELFRQLAYHAQPGFRPSPEDLEQIGHICRLVQGMPLAIVLAAAWVDLLSPDEIADEIIHNLDFLITNKRDVPERHHSLRAVFDYAWNRLSASEQIAFARLSVFRGSFSRSAAQQVTDTNLSVLQTLVDKALLQRTTTGRFSVHGILRQFSEEQLWALGEANPRMDAHCQFFARMMQEKEAEFRGKRQPQALKMIEDDIENIRAAWNRALRQQDGEMLISLLHALFRFYEMRSWFQEGETVFGQAVRQFATEVHPTPAQQLVLGKLLARQGSFAHRLGQYQKAEQLLQTSLLIFRIAEVREEIAFALTGLSDVARAVGLFDESARYCEESLQILRELSDQWGIAATLNNLGVTAYHSRRYPEAREYFEECLIISRELDDQYGLVMALNNLGVLVHDLGDFDEAQRLYGRALVICRALNDLYGIAASLINFGRVAYLRGEYESAQEQCQESLRISRELGHRWGIAASLINLGDIACALADCEQTRSYFSEALRISAAIGAVPLTIEIVVATAALLIAEGQAGAALELLAWLQGHPPTDKEVSDRLEHLWTSLSAGVPREVLNEVQVQASEREFRDITHLLFRLL